MANERMTLEEAMASTMRILLTFNRDDRNADRILRLHDALMDDDWSDEIDWDDFDLDELLVPERFKPLMALPTREYRRHLAADHGDLRSHEIDPDTSWKRHRAHQHRVVHHAA